MPDGRIEFSVELDAKDAEQELTGIKKKIIKLEAELHTQQGRKTALEEELSKAGAVADQAKAKLAELEAERARLQALTPADGAEYLTASTRLAQLNAEIKEQQSLVKEAEKDFNASASAVDKCDAEIQKTNGDLETQKILYGELAKEAAALPGKIKGTSETTSQMSAAAKEAAKRFEKLGDRIVGLAKRVFVFTLITAGLRQLRTWLWNTIKANDEARAAVARLKGALLTMVQPIVNVIIPAFTALINILAKVVTAIANAVSILFGTTAKASAAAAENLYNEQKALEGVGGAAAKAGKQLAGFDEINKLGETSGEGGGGASADTGIAPNFTSVIDGQLGAVAELFTGIALVALGAIITFSGASIPLGLGMIVTGGLMVWNAVSENWQTIEQALQGPIGFIAGILGGALLVIGAILTFSGANLPLGIGLMVVGAAGLAAVAAINWDTISEALQGPIGGVTALASVALLALGAIFLFSGAGIPLGLGLLFAGAVGLATAIVPNWDWLLETINGVFEDIARWFNTNVKPKLTLEYWTEKFSAIGNGFKEGIKAGINAGIEAVEKGLNWMISKINLVSFDVPDWVPFIGGEKFGFSIPQVSIPRLAHGAVIPPNREFMAVLGDQKSGTNIETPLETMVEAFRQAMAEQGGGTVTVVVNLDGREVARNTVRHVNDMTRAAGRPVLLT